MSTNTSTTTIGDADAQPFAPATDGRTASPMAPTRLLIVDDTPMNIALARAVLEADGFLVEGATDAADAMHKVFRFFPEVILMDIQMPGMDGLKLTSILKTTQATTHVVVIAFTAYAMRGDEEKMRAMGCDGYLSKPIEVKTFAAQVRKQIALAAARPSVATAAGTG